MDTTLAHPGLDLPRLGEAFRHARSDSVALLTPLAEADAVLAPADGTPPLWHLGHTTWFLETYLLRPFAERVPAGHPVYDALFAQEPNAPLIRPSATEIMDWARRVDEAVQAQLSAESVHQPQIPALLALAIQHEYRHQEALLEDILALYAASPFRPAYRSAPELPTGTAPAHGWLEHPGGEVRLGAEGAGFAHDDERPRHRRWLPPFALGSRLVTNAEFQAFVEDGGYRRRELWLAEGWRARSAGDWQAPAHWVHLEGQWWTMSLYGMIPLHPAAPVAHLSYFEADAYARWAGARLPDEAEWETLAAAHPGISQARGEGLFVPRPANGGDGPQFHGALWEWTRSPYAPYPGHRPPAVATAEFDGRFPPGHGVLRGGACITPAARLRPTLREHAPAACRRRFTGLRLARDLD